MSDRAKARSTPHRRAVLLAAMLAAGAASGAGRAAAASTPALVGLSVVDRRTGAELPFWRQGGRPFVAGEPGRRYGLRVANRTDGRVLLVLSVDGVNVLSGETAGYGQRGYVLDPYETYDVNGWRKSSSEVAAFTFTALSGSYAARTGRPGDVGVIGMAVFRERDSPPPFPAPMRQSEAPAAATLAPPMDKPAGDAARAAARRSDERLGTAHGAREESLISMVGFERATSFPQLLRRIEYDTPAHLLARGVTPPFPAGRPPRAFPLQPGDGFVPDPPGER